MINFINDLARKFFGTKADKDIEEIQPYVEQINDVTKTLQNLSDDQLRAKTTEFKQRISDYLKDDSAVDDYLKTLKQRQRYLLDIWS